MIKFTKPAKLEKFICALQDVLSELEREKNNEESLWGNLFEVVESEMNELLEYALKCEVYFKYGKKQRMLESTYFITDTMEPLDFTPLGKKIFAVQDIYKKL